MRKLKDVVSLFFMTLCFDLGIVAKKIPGAQLVSQRLPACFIPTAAPVHTCDPEIYDWHPVTYSSVRLRPSSLSKPLEALVDIKMWWVRRQCNNSRPRFSQLHQTDCQKKTHRCIGAWFCGPLPAKLRWCHSPKWPSRIPSPTPSQTHRLTEKRLLQLSILMEEISNRTLRMYP